MKVKLEVSRVGPKGSQARGEVAEVDADEAKRMIEAGQAVPVRAPAPERAVSAGKAERAVKGK